MTRTCWLWQGRPAYAFSYTGDRDLIEDFKDKQFIDRPRGKVYTRAANAELLAATACAARAR